MDKERLGKDLSIPLRVREFALKHSEPMVNNWCRWIEDINGELVIRLFAFRFNKKNGQTLLTEVERSVIGEEYGLRKNCYYTYMGGYTVVYEPKTKKSYSYGYAYTMFEENDFNKWYNELLLPAYHGKVLNPEALKKFEKYKYCGYSGKQPLKEYLELYNKYPQVEYFGKLELIATKGLVKKASKDREFVEYLKNNIEDCNHYGYANTVYAYNHKCSFVEAQRALNTKREIDRYFRDFKKTKQKVNKAKIKKWIEENKIDCAMYKDYWEACVEMKLDMTDSKNSMPKEFKRMHDIRTDEYADFKIRKRTVAQKKADAEVEQISNKWLIIPESKEYTVKMPNGYYDFEKEGLALNHCVAKMGYFGRMREGLILIAFIREKEHPETPLYTVEYNFREKKIMQAYGINDTEPPKKAIAYINEWGKAIRGLQNVEKKNRRQRAC